MSFGLIGIAKPLKNSSGKARRKPADHPMRLANFYDLRALRRNQWRTPRDVERIQDRKLSNLIRHAWTNVPYYRKLLTAAGLRPEDIKNREDLRLIPVTTKRILQDLPLHEKTAAGTDLRRCRITFSSGTTGMPLKIFMTSHDATLMNLSWVRAYLSNGMKPWYAIAVFIGQREENSRKSWYQHLGLWRKHEISAWRTAQDWIEELQRHKPQVIAGYVMSLKLLAEAIQAKGITGIEPKAIFHSSAILDEASRRFLTSVFRAPVIDFYGADEAGCIAWECPRCSSYHVNSDLVIVETLRNGKSAGPGEEGDVVITNLHSSAMPFIRYSLGDIGILSPKTPSCGRGLPLLEKIQGRTDDFILLKSGRRISPHPIYHCLDPVPGIRRWRMVQRDIRHLVLELEPGGAFSTETISLARDNLMGLFQGEIEIIIQEVSLIPISPRAKFRAVTSELRSGVS